MVSSWMERTLVAGGTGYGSGSYPEAHFGLGDEEEALGTQQSALN